MNIYILYNKFPITLNNNYIITHIKIGLAIKLLLNQFLYAYMLILNLSNWSSESSIPNLIASSENPVTTILSLSLPQSIPLYLSISLSTITLSSFSLFC